MNNYNFGTKGKRTTIGFIMTTKCPVGCRHCIIHKGSCPEPSPDSYRCWIQSISESGIIKKVSLAGGEPFAVYDTLLDVVSLIYENGMYPNVLTSAYWARSEADAEKLLAPLVRAGLNGFSVSIDEFHQEKIPIQYVQRAIRVAKQLGLWVGISYRYYRAILSDDEVESEIRDILGKVYEDIDVINANIIIKDGRTHQQVEFPQQRSDEQNKAFRACALLLPSLWPDGNVQSCCGPRLPERNPLIIGNLNNESFIKIYRRFREHPIIPFIEVLGLAKMVEELNDNGLGVDLNDFTAPDETCLLCQKMLNNKEYVDFFVKRYHNPTIQRQLGVKRFLLYGNSWPLISAGWEK